MKPVKVTHVITGLHTGGSETMLWKLLSTLPRDEFNSRVISLTGRGEIGERIEKLGIPVSYFHFNRGLFFLPEFLRLIGEFRRTKPEIIQTWMYHADLIGGLAGRATGIRRVAWGIRNSTLESGKSKTTTRFVVKLCAFLSRVIPQKIVACSTIAGDVHVRLGYDRNRMTIIPNGFDMQVFRRSPEEGEVIRSSLGITPKQKVAGMVARFDPQKNHFGFLNAARIVLNRAPETRFILCGAGIDQGNRMLTGWIKELGLETAVFLLGNRNDIPAIMSSMDVHVLSSVYGEAFPNVLGEAMACETPCVAANVGDAAYIINNCGIIVPPGEPEALAKAMLEILFLPPPQWAEMGQRSRARIISEFSLFEVAQQYASFYRSLLA